MKVAKYQLLPLVFLSSQLGQDQAPEMAQLAYNIHANELSGKPGYVSSKPAIFIDNCMDMKENWPTAISFCIVGAGSLGIVAAGLVLWMSNFRARLSVESKVVAGQNNLDTKATFNAFNPNQFLTKFYPIWQDYFTRAGQLSSSTSWSELFTSIRDLGQKYGLDSVAQTAQSFASALKHGTILPPTGAIAGIFATLTQGLPSSAETKEYLAGRTMAREIRDGMSHQQHIPSSVLVQNRVRASATTGEASYTRGGPTTTFQQARKAPADKAKDRSEKRVANHEAMLKVARASHNQPASTATPQFL